MTTLGTPAPDHVGPLKITIEAKGWFEEISFHFYGKEKELGDAMDAAVKILRQKRGKR